MVNFDREILNILRGTGITYLVSQSYVPELKVDEDTAEFILYPYTSLEEAEIFINKNSKGKYEEQQDLVLYEIADEEVLEMADGVLACSFYLKEK